MFCKNCGKEIKDGATFCNYCGTKVSNSRAAQIQPYAATASQEETPVYNVNNENLTIEEEIKRIQIADDVIREVFQYIDRAEQTETSSAQVGKINWFGIGFKAGKSRLILIIPFAVFVLVMALVAAVFKSENMSVILGIVAGVATFLYMRKGNTAKKKVLLQLADDDRKYAEEILKKNATAIAFVPKNYRYPIATSYMREMFETGRVKSINEALDKFDNYLHQLTMENTQSAMLAEAQAQAGIIKGAAGVSVATDIIRLITWFT